MYDAMGSEISFSLVVAYIQYGTGIDIKPAFYSLFKLLMEYLAHSNKSFLFCVKPFKQEPYEEH